VVGRAGSHHPTSNDDDVSRSWDIHFYKILWFIV